jgi:hypothetical protein
MDKSAEEDRLFMVVMGLKLMHATTTSFLIGFGHP